MPLLSGARLGPYEVTALLGAGGMGEVYRARDTKLGRDVALKVLSSALVRDKQYMARFEREARVLASLNHPNVASIYGLEESGEERALVMELGEGETLAHRIDRGPIPLDEALELARQMAVALEYAHEKGVVATTGGSATRQITFERRPEVSIGVRSGRRPAIGLCSS